MPLEDVRRTNPGWRVAFVLAGLGLLGALVVAWIRAGHVPWRVIQERFYTSTATRIGPEGLKIRQIIACTSRVDRCTTCHVGFDRRDLADDSIPLPFRAHGPGLGAHRPERIGCSCCHGGNGRILDPDVAHGLPGGRVKDPLMAEPFIQASCSQCHVPGSSSGQERLVRGVWLYLGLGCALCHPLSRGGRGGWDFGPDLRAIGRRDVEALETSLLDPARDLPGSTMPSFRQALGGQPEAMVDLLVFVVSLGLDRYPACGDLARSLDQVEAPCATCHGYEGGRAGGRLEHRCRYILRKAGELRCGRCHRSSLPGPGPGHGYCPAVTGHRPACSACHEGAWIPGNLPVEGDRIKGAGLLDEGIG